MMANRMSPLATYRFPATSCRPCQWYSTCRAPADWAAGVLGEYQMRPHGTSAAPASHRLGQAPKARANAPRKAQHAQRAARPARIAASANTAQNGAIHTQW